MGLLDKNVRKAERNKIYSKLALMAPSGGGKTYGALNLATGMAEEIEKETGKEAKILMLNTEHTRGSYYANEFNYDIYDVEAPHEPEKYIQLINEAVQLGYDILIIDSASHEWEGKGGCLELQQKAGGTYQAWGKITPRHNRFINAIADSPIHIIATMRGKDQYEVEKDERGKTSVKKLGVGAKQRDGFEYEFTATFLIDQKTNMAEVQKDNTHIFENEGAVKLSKEHGRRIIQWANSGKGDYVQPKRNEENADTLSDVVNKIIKRCTEVGGAKNKELMDTLAKFVTNKNPHAIKDLGTANACLDAVNNIKPINK